MRTEKRGFSLVELVIAIGIFALCAMLSAQSLRGAFAYFDAQHEHIQAEMQLDEIASRFAREAASSDGIWISGQGSAAALNFSLLDGNGRVRHWQYAFPQHLERRDLTTGNSAGIAQSEAIRDMTFASLPVSRLGEGDASEFFTKIPTARDAAYIVDSDGIAGNTVSVVTLRINGGRRVLHLLPSASANGFGVENGVLWHSVIWRSTSTRRFLFGLGQKTDYHIMGEVAYTTDNWKTSHTWCSYDLYGALDVADPRAQSDYRDAAQRASSIYAGCKRITGQETIPAVPAAARRIAE